MQKTRSLKLGSEAIRLLNMTGFPFCLDMLLSWRRAIDTKNYTTPLMLGTV